MIEASGIILAQHNADEQIGKCIAAPREYFVSVLAVYEGFWTAAVMAAIQLAIKWLYLAISK